MEGRSFMFAIISVKLNVILNERDTQEIQGHESIS